MGNIVDHESKHPVPIHHYSYLRCVHHSSVDSSKRYDLHTIGYVCTLTLANSCVCYPSVRVVAGSYYSYPVWGRAGADDNVDAG